MDLSPFDISQRGDVDRVSAKLGTSAGSKYCVRSLIQRANRFLAHVRQEDTAPASLGLFCWKHEEVVLSEPSSTHILEQCEIAGYGRFSALSNGELGSERVQGVGSRCGVVDMVSTKRSGGYPNPGGQIAGTCRLLLQNGQYQMVSIQQPGQFKRCHLKCADTTFVAAENRA
ncbi:hypothetical protein DPMN_086381 [Dreissena polymorpha]|uniref:Uncharacterized protein n=1 Tax=Dreissena polymorpha TaxID=45954 RepID=A0A9D4KR24_DREPO|nr:hypothetical protein DPMN_086381 [Dreissena polymorpha]